MFFIQDKLNQLRKPYDHALEISAEIGNLNKARLEALVKQDQRTSIQSMAKIYTLTDELNGILSSLWTKS